MADEYIKRDDALKLLHKNWGKYGTSTEAFEVTLYQYLIIPAADVRPVVRGRWVDGKCDNCGEHAPYWCLATTFHESNYCPNCGAKMEVQDDD